MFKIKTTEELEKMTSTELDQYKADLKAQEKADILAEVSKETKEAIKEAQKTLETFLADEIAKQLLDQTSKGQAGSSYEDQLKKALEDNHEKIKEIAKNGNGLVEITLKAVGDITTANGDKYALHLAGTGTGTFSKLD
jgi:histidinol dehydrogenase